MCLSSFVADYSSNWSINNMLKEKCFILCTLLCHTSELMIKMNNIVYLQNEFNNFASVDITLYTQCKPKVTQTRRFTKCNDTHEVAGLLICHTAVTRPTQYAVWLSWSNVLFNPVTSNMIDQCTITDETSGAIESPRCACSLYIGLKMAGRYTNACCLSSSLSDVCQPIHIPI
jgi:hypothetical protein